MKKWDYDLQDGYSYVVVSFVSEAADHDGNYHLYDTQFFYMNLKNSVRKRIEAFKK